MLKPSPGPWVISPLNDRCVGFMDDTNDPRVHAVFHAVADIRTRPNGETMPNARLIAAAPELLAAAKELAAIQFTEGFLLAVLDNVTNQPVLKIAVEHARAAIQKAE